MKENNKEIKITKEQIPAAGSLGLLALGDVGVRLWKEAKKKKDEEKLKNDENKKI